jgi:Domain of unknown function (DUF4175)
MRSTQTHSALILSRISDATSSTDRAVVDPVSCRLGDVQRARRILEELRRRFGENFRPQLELEYIERLLRDY